MKSTTVVSLTKIAQMLTSRIGRKPLLLTLAATMACLQTAMAASPRSAAAVLERCPQTHTAGMRRRLPAGGANQDGSRVTVAPTHSGVGDNQTPGGDAPGGLDDFKDQDSHGNRELPEGGHTSGGSADTTKKGAITDKEKLAAIKAKIKALDNEIQAKTTNSGAIQPTGEKTKSGQAFAIDQEDQIREESEKQNEIDDLKKKKKELTLIGEDLGRKKNLVLSTLATTAGAIGMGIMLKSISSGAIGGVGAIAGIAALGFLVMVGLYLMTRALFPASNRLGAFAVVLGGATLNVGLIMGAIRLEEGGEGAKHVGDLMPNTDLASTQLLASWIVVAGAGIIILALLALIIQHGLKNGSWFEVGKSFLITAGALSLVGLGANLGHVITKCATDGFEEDFSLIHMGFIVGCSLIGFLFLAYMLFRNEGQKWEVGKWSKVAAMTLAVTSSACLSGGMVIWMDDVDNIGDGAPEAISTGAAALLVAAGVGLIAMFVMFIMKKTCYKEGNNFFGRHH